MDYGKTTAGDLEQPPWADIHADDPVVVSRDGTVIVRRTYHNIRVPEWPALTVEASVTKPPDPDRALKETLATIRALKMYYALVDELPGPAGHPEPTGSATEHPTDYRTDDDSGTESTDGLTTDFTVGLDLRDAPPDLPRFLAHVARTIIPVRATHRWLPEPGISTIIVHSIKGKDVLHVALSGPTAFFDVRVGKSSNPTSAQKATVKNDGKADVTYEINHWRKI
jgi:hypothetical protein